MHKTQVELTEELHNAATHVKVGALYAHYKQSDKAYKVLNLAITESDDEVCVVYQAQHGNNIIFVRPLTSWLDKIEFEGGIVNRFSLVK